MPVRNSMLGVVVLTVATVGLGGVAGARTAEEAKAFAEKAVAHVKSVGEEKAFADFSRPDGGYVDGELYMFCYAPDGTNKAHGGNPAFVGRIFLGSKIPMASRSTRRSSSSAWTKGRAGSTSSGRTP
jgi:cytochrome c